MELPVLELLLYLHTLGLRGFHTDGSWLFDLKAENLVAVSLTDCSGLPNGYFDKLKEARPLLEVSALTDLH